MLEDRPQRRQVVVAEPPDERAHRRRHPRAHREGADEPVLRGEVRLVRAHRDDLAPGRGTGQPQCGARRVRGVLAELHHVRTRHDRQEVLGRRQLQHGGAAERDPVGQHGPHGVEHGRVPVSQGHRAHAHAVLDELVAVDVPDPRALPADQHRRHALGVLVGALGERVRPARDDVVQAGLQRVRVLEAREHVQARLLVVVGRSAGRLALSGAACPVSHCPGCRAVRSHCLVVAGEAAVSPPGPNGWDRPRTGCSSCRTSAGAVAPAGRGAPVRRGVRRRRGCVTPPGSPGRGLWSPRSGPAACRPGLAGSGGCRCGWIG